MENKKIALLFAGQGAQYLGMGQEFYQKYDYVKNLYQIASSILGYDLTQITFSENTLINQTKYTQPSILVTSLAIYEVLIKEFNLKPSLCAGFSLGEYSALYASGVFNFQNIITLIKNRASFMDEAASKNKGGMAAIIGMDKDILSTLCKEVGNVSIANYNCPGQLVVGGLYDSVALLVDKAKQNGAKRAIMLNVSGGFHTSLMQEASNKMYDLVQDFEYKKPIFDIYMNYNAQPLDISTLPLMMKKQIDSPVRFEETIRNMIDTGVDLFVEIGPGSVLSGFVKKIDATKKVITIDKLNDLELLSKEI